jgi:hypothetical protein
MLTPIIRANVESESEVRRGVMLTPNYYHRGWEVFSQRERGIMLGGRERVCPFLLNDCVKIKSVFLDKG